MALSHTPLPRAGAAMHRQHASKTNGLAGPGGSGIWIMSLGAAPPEADFSLRFFWSAENVGPGCDHCADWADQACDAAQC